MLFACVDVLAMLDTYPVVHHSAGQKVYTHQLCEMNTKCIQILHTEYFKLLKLNKKSYTVTVHSFHPTCHEVLYLIFCYKCINIVLDLNSLADL
jgi:hypothetical protein